MHRLVGPASILLFAVTLTGRAPLEALSERQLPPVAIAGGSEIETESFRRQFIAYLLATGLNDASSLRRLFLENLISSRLVYLEAIDSGIEAAADYRARYQLTEAKLLLEAYQEEVIHELAEVTQGDLEDQFIRVNTTLRARHLYAPSREEADALHARLELGESFEDLAREVFADSALANNGGLLGDFSFDEMDASFEDAAFNLAVGQISRPVRTAQGYSVIQLLDRFTRPILTETEFAQRKAQLERYVRHRKRMSARTNYAESLAAEAGPTFHEPAFSLLLGQITGTSVLGGEEFGEWLDAPLVTFRLGGRSRTWTVGMFRERAQGTDERQRAQVRTRAALVRFVTGLLVRETMLEAARARNLDNQPRIRSALAQEMEDWVFEETKKRIMAEVAVSEDSIRAYFERFPTEYMEPARVRVREILVSDRTQADELKQQVRGDNFESMARLHSIRPGADISGVHLGFRTKAELGAAGPEVFGAAEGDVIGPFAHQEGFVILLVGPRQEARAMSLEEARPAIRNELYAVQGRARLARYAEGLRSRHPVTVDTEVLGALSLVPSR